MASTRTRTKRTTAKRTAHRKSKRRKKLARRGGKPKREPDAAQASPAYTHLTKLRCPRCGLLMKADGTRDGGRVKRWVCPSAICRRRSETVGEEV